MPVMVKAPIDELESLRIKSPILFENVLNKIAKATIEGKPTQRFDEQLATLFANTLAYADMLGRKRILLYYNKMTSIRNFDTIGRSIARGDKYYLGVGVLYWTGSGLSESKNDAKIYSDYSQVANDASNLRIRYNSIKAVHIEVYKASEGSEEFHFAEELERPDSNIPEVPKVQSFQDAIDDLISRYPVLAKDYESVSKVYSAQNAFALAKSTSLTITNKVKEIMQSSLQKGEPISKAKELIAAAGDFTKAYSETVYRTNLNTSYTAGMFKEMETPAVRSITPAFRFSAVLDSDCRPNHRAMDGVVASVDDPVWHRFCPPIGYNCRCSVIPVDFISLKEMGMIRESDGAIFRARVPEGAYPDVSFKSFGGISERPDKGIYGF